MATQLFDKIFSIRGTVNQTEFCGIFLGLGLLVMIQACFQKLYGVQILSGIGGPDYIGFYVALIFDITLLVYISFNVTSKRLRDAGMSNFWVIPLFLTYIVTPYGFGMLFFSLAFFRSQYRT